MAKFKDRQLIVRVPLPRSSRMQCCLPVGVVSFVTGQMEWDDPMIYDGLSRPNPLFRQGLVRTWAMGDDEHRWCPAIFWEPFYPNVEMVEIYMEQMRRLSMNPPTLEDNFWYRRMRG